MYRSLFDVQKLAWCTEACLVYRSLLGVQKLVWCTEACLVYRSLFDVQKLVWCTEACLMYKSMCFTIQCSLFIMLCMGSIRIIIMLWERSGSVVECLTHDRGGTGSSLTGVTGLCPWFNPGRFVPT